MKRNLVALASALAIGCGAMWGVPACPDPGTVYQPDGTPVAVMLHGDEFMNFLTTADGYTVVKNSSGIYTYAELGADGSLQPGHIAASDASMRDASTKVYLMGVQKYLAPAPTATGVEMSADRSRMAVQPGQRGLYDYKKFKGLVILAEYTDCAFSRTDADSLFTDMVTKKDYDGYMSTGTIPSRVPYTGSVRDYFRDNSHGVFEPDFDVVGPVKVNYSQYYVNQTTNARTLIKAVCEAANDIVDFSKYDTDNDGVVDMFYVIFAGGGSNFSGNDERLIWPHAWNLTNPVIDGVKLNRYACSTELYGNPNSKRIDGIGTICHEFSHVLGLMDEYDTDYTTNGQSHDPGYWSVMAGGSYLNYAITPCGYSMLQRWQSGFAVPKELTAPGSYSLADIDESNTGYRLSLPYRADEYWLMENRRKTGNKWNCYLPGEGMLVFRVDSTAPAYWTANKINAYSSHNYYEMVRAYNTTNTSDLSSDPFPGTRGVTELTPTTSPALVAWNREEPNYGLTDIKEDTDGIISFTLKEMEAIDTRMEDWEDITTEGSYDVRVAGKVGRWTFENASVEAPGSAFCSGTKALGLVKGSTATVGPVYGKMKSVQFTITNSAMRGAYFQLLYQDSVGNWISLYNTSNVGNISLAAGTSATHTFIIPEKVRKNMHLRLKISSGDSSSKIWMDDFATRMIKDDEYVGVIGNEISERGLNWSVDASELRVYGEEGTRVEVYGITGIRVAGGIISGGVAVFARPASGAYILTAPGMSKKVVI